ncbi:hypothetical protein BDW59DRAFT_161604 [Aspergillus cavernicola]|uniref:Uncharacterized protein n=1 Tax=Aspergillus cavernicola TaxID=176166 RepID=A0ABR4IEF6_9EURO
MDYTTFGDPITADTPLSPIKNASLLRLLYPDGAGSNAQDPDSDEGPWRRLIIFSGLLNQYTTRQMTNESDSLNAFRGMLTSLGDRLIPDGFVYGLPLNSHPISLAWMHLEGATPKRRAQFPSWSWTGWEGAVVFPEKLLDYADRQSRKVVNDLEPRFLASEGNEISVEGWVVHLDIRTDPIKRAFRCRTARLNWDGQGRIFISQQHLANGDLYLLGDSKACRAHPGP